VVIARVALGGLLVLVGAVWFGQGVGWLGGSFMSGAAIWAVIGAACIAGGGWLVLSTARAARH
jgi:hypothetical protein